MDMGDNAAATNEVYVRPYTGPSYNRLPMEIILQIMNYLPPTDLHVASLASRRWFEAAQYSQFADQMTLNFAQCTLVEGSEPVDTFLCSVRNYTSIVLNQVEFGSANAEFWERIGDSIESLAIRNCDLREKNLKAIVLRLADLRTLCIENCRELFMSGRLFETDQTTICQSFARVERLALVNNRYLSDALFQRFVSIMPALRALDLSGCHISFHKGLYKKFYPDRQNGVASESVLTFHYISQFIECEAAQLKEFNFSGTLIDGSALQTLAAMPALQLERLELRACDQLTMSGIVSLVQMQTGLRELDLSASVRLADQALLEICTHLAQLEVLRLRRCRAITDDGVGNIARLKRLRVLDLSECDGITGKGVVAAIGLGQNSNERLHELSLSALNICQQTIINVCEACPALRAFDLSFCKNAVSNLVVQWICRHLVWLRVLNLDYCEKISDAALTGIDMATTISKYETDKTLPPLDDDSTIESAAVALHDENPFKISLRSKAEEDIVNDAKRKRFMLAMFEKHADIPGRVMDNCSGFSINSLRGLRELRLTACNRVTDVTLKYSVRLPELRHISLAKCQQISIVGIASLVQHCPSLERVNLSECHNINDKAIELLTLHAKRLTHLQLERCSLLTDHTLDHLAVNCERLRELDVRGCRAMCSEPNMRLVSLRSLRNVIQSKPGPYLMEQTYKQPKPPPPMPPPAATGRVPRW